MVGMQRLLKPVMLNALEDTKQPARRRARSARSAQDPAEERGGLIAWFPEAVRLSGANITRAISVTKGVTRIVRKKVPQKPMRAFRPKYAVSAQTAK
jgi:hypothetical protein